MKTSENYFVWSILIELLSFFTNKFNSFNEPIFISEWIEINGSFSSVNICNFLPTVLFSRVIIANSCKLKRFSNPQIKLINPVLVIILNFFNNVSQEIFIYCYHFNKTVNLESIVIIALSININFRLYVELRFFSQRRSKSVFFIRNRKLWWPWRRHIKNLFHSSESFELHGLFIFRLIRVLEIIINFLRW
jgi:hypothetical protein